MVRAAIDSLRSFASSLLLTCRSIAYVAAHAPMLGALALACEVAASCAPLANLWIVRDIINLLTVHVGRADLPEPGRTLWTYLVLYGLFSAVIYVVRTLQRAVNENLRDHLTHETQVSLLAKVNSLKDVCYFEIPEFHDKFRDAQVGASQRMASVLDMLTGLLGSTITLTGAVVLFAKADTEWWIGALMILGVLPHALYSFWVAKQRVSVFHAQSQESRMLNYYAQSLMNPRLAKEIRTYALGDEFLRRYRNCFASLFAKARSLRSKMAVRGMPTALGSSLTTSVVFAWLAFRALRGQISVGDTVMYVGLIERVMSGLYAMVNCIVFTYTNNLHLENYFAFMSLPGLVSIKLAGLGKRVTLPLAKGFEFRSISFKYPGSSTWVLRNLSFTIPAGKTVALVGPNGAGKTTIIKLLSRLYDPTEGEIFLDGVALREYDLDDLRSRQATVFQDFGRYSMTVGDNIALGDVGRPVEQSWLRQAAQMARADEILDRLPLGLKTMLGREFEGGTELSEGQWQRVAIARAFARDAPIVILDEPTAALDPETEYELYRRFDNLMSGRTGILISHRLSSCRMADRIIVIKGGCLVESGTHDELLSVGGLYHRLFVQQAEGYALAGNDGGATLRPL